MLMRNIIRDIVQRLAGYDGRSRHLVVFKWIEIFTRRYQTIQCTAYIVRKMWNTCKSLRPCNLHGQHCTHHEYHEHDFSFVAFVAIFFLFCFVFWVHFHFYAFLESRLKCFLHYKWFACLTILTHWANSWIRL